MDLLPTAIRYREASLCVLPAYPKEKRPALGDWKKFRSHLPTTTNIQSWFNNERTEALCLVTGEVSGHLEFIDFDCQGESYPAWEALVLAKDPALLRRLAIEKSPSGGRHVIYRCTEKVSSSKHLAKRKELVDGAGLVERFGKSFKPRKDKDGLWHIQLVTIETRGEGAICLCAPSPGYELLQGDIADLPVLGPTEREILLQSAWELGEVWPETLDPQPKAPDLSLRPGDDFNQRGDLVPMLEKHGWTRVGGNPNGNQYWRRPGKAEGCSATLKDGVFYVFSQNATPFESGQGYSRFSVYAMLEHGGHFQKAAKELHAQGFGQRFPPNPPSGTDGSTTEPPHESDQFKVDIRTFSDTPKKSIPWIWPGVIPKGMTSLLAGKQGMGKSFVVCDLAARYSTSKPMPDGFVCEPGRVLLLTREDDAGCVLLPRLYAAGADLDRVYWSVFANDRNGKLLDLVRHMGRLLAMIEERKISLIIVDTFAAFAPAGTDGNSAQEVRHFIDALNHLARQSGAAVLIIAHMRKTGPVPRGDAMDEVAGSMQMTAGVRVASILSAGIISGEYWLRVVKSNLGKLNTRGWVWRFVDTGSDVLGDEACPRIEWHVNDEEPVTKSIKLHREHQAEVNPLEVLNLLKEIVSRQPLCKTDAVQKIWKQLRAGRPLLRKVDVAMEVSAILEEPGICLQLAKGHRGNMFICMKGITPNTPADLALRLAEENPGMSSRALQQVANCRKSTAQAALREARRVANSKQLESGSQQNSADGSQ